MIALLLLCATVAHPLEKAETCDMLELNHFYDPSHGYQYSQVIAWIWDGEYLRMDTVAWRLVEPEVSVLELPVKVGNQWQAMHYDTEARDMVSFYAPRFRQTWTFNDPEKVNKKLLREGCRQKLLFLCVPR